MASNTKLSTGSDICQGITYLTLHCGFLDRGVFLLAVAVWYLGYVFRMTVNFGDFKGDRDVLKWTLLPCHWLTILISSPILVALELYNLIKSNFMFMKSYFVNLQSSDKDISAARVLTPVNCMCNVQRNLITLAWSSISHLVTQFCLVTFWHWGITLVCSISVSVSSHHHWSTHFISSTGLVHFSSTCVVLQSVCGWVAGQATSMVFFYHMCQVDSHCYINSHWFLFCLLELGPSLCSRRCCTPD